MRLSDLLGAEVVDEKGRRTGMVHDVRLIQDGPLLGSFGAAFAIEGLIAGRGAFGARLGFDRSNVEGPWALKHFFTWFHRDSVFVPWERVRAIAEGCIYIKGSSEDLDSPEPISE